MRCYHDFFQVLSYHASAQPAEIDKIMVSPVSTKIPYTVNLESKAHRLPVYWYIRTNAAIVQMSAG